MSHDSLILRIANQKNGMAGFKLSWGHFERITNSNGELAKNYVSLIRIVIQI